MNKKKIPINYRELQKIKSEEYQHFFTKRLEFSPYMNHLGEIQWMSEEESSKQHEFFSYEPSVFQRWKKRIFGQKKLDIEKFSGAEREFRLRCRSYLDRKYLNKIQSQTEKHLPSQWLYDIKDGEIENIPLTFDTDTGSILKPALNFLGVFVILTIMIYFWFDYRNNDVTGQLLVHSNVAGTRIYSDEINFLGYSEKLIKSIPGGRYKISATKEGYISFPEYRDIEIVSDSILILDFNLEPARSDIQGFLRVVTEHQDSKVFIDNQYLGIISELPVIVLNDGQHLVNIRRDGFVSVPREKVVSISPGDTTILVVQQVSIPPAPSRSSSDIPESGIGSIEITSNIKGARIILNGNDSENLTDYVFAQLKYGKYLVEVQKNGYLVEPPYADVEINSNSYRKSIHFTLIQEFERISIKTTPSRGSIFIDGEFKGEGNFEGDIKIGPHKISFGELSGYKRPRNHTVEIQAGFPEKLDIVYFPQLNIVAEVTNNGNLQTKNCELFTGHTYSNRAFTASEEGGPTVAFNEVLNDYAWKLGYAFAYRNPKGNNALKLVFKLPGNLNYEQTFIVRLLCAASKEKYPLTVSSKPDIEVKLNNTKLSYQFTPKYLEDFGKLETIDFDVTYAVKSGDNSFEVSTTDINNNYFYIKKIEIFN